MPPLPEKTVSAAVYTIFICIQNSEEAQFCVHYMTALSASHVQCICALYTYIYFILSVCILI